jgi:hypothetical protein
VNKGDLNKIIAKPGAERRGKPFWAWNGELCADEIRRQVNIMNEMGFGGFFMHSRAGLATEYLGSEWMDMVEAAADEAEKLGMEAWLYDEDRWPSGSAGGLVTEDSRFCMKSLVMTVLPLRLYDARRGDIYSDEKIHSVFAASVDGLDLYAYSKIDDSADIERWYNENDPNGSGKAVILLFSVVPDSPSNVYNEATYIDTMNRAATERFIELTHEKYAARFGDRFGKSIKGIFTDEPHRGHAMDDTKRNRDGSISCSLAWTEDFFEEFEKRYGYDAVRRLPEIFFKLRGENVSDVRHDWFDLACNLFIERFVSPVNKWCENHNLILTGHFLHEDSLTNQAVPNGSVMRSYGHMGYPGVDVLTEGNRCYWIVKQLESSARQLGKKTMLSELYGCTGWQFDMKGHKSVGDWQALFGVNLRCPHLSWYTMEGEAKRDYPASIFYQSPFYKYYNIIETYFARFGTLVSESKRQCDLLVLNPVESVWAIAHLGWANWIFSADRNVDLLQTHYENVFKMLEGAHIDFDYGEEQMLAEMWSIGNDEKGRAILTLGEASYHTVLVSGMLTIRSTTLSVLRRFAAAGGRVLFTEDIPEYVDARKSEEAQLLASDCTVVKFDEASVSSAVLRGSEFCVSLSDGECECRDVYVRIGTLEPDRLMCAAIVNTDTENGKNRLILRVKTGRPYHVEQWDLMTGKKFCAAKNSVYADGYMCIYVSVEAAGSAFYIFTDENDRTLPPAPEYGSVIACIPVRESVGYELSEDNICVLDFAKWRFSGDEWHRQEDILRVDRKIREHFGLEYRSGEMLQPWYIKKRGVKSLGRIELEFEFFIDSMPSKQIYLALERPDNFDIKINGRPFREKNGEAWIDCCFVKLAVNSAMLRFGRNTINLSVEYTELTNLEALYLVGNFGASFVKHTVSLNKLPENLKFEELYRQRLPFYTGEVIYKLSAEMLQRMLPADILESLCRSVQRKVFLRIDSFSGSMMVVRADGMADIPLISDPFEADITDAVKAGSAIDLVLVGTRRNLFGPLHLTPAYSESYGPNSFMTSGESYDDGYILTRSGVTGLSLVVREPDGIKTHKL